MPTSISKHVLRTVTIGLCFIIVKASVEGGDLGAAFGGKYPEPLSTRRDIELAPPGVGEIDIRDLPLECYPLLTKFQSLKKVKLVSYEQNSTTDSNLTVLASLNFTNLSYINLTNCRLVTDAGIRSLLTIASLRHLQLEGTGITNESCQALASNAHIAIVNVANCKAITRTGLRSLATSETLENIRFSADNLSQQDVLDLVSAFKTVNWCEIVDTQHKLVLTCNDMRYIV